MLGNTKLSQDVSRSLRSNNIQGTLRDPNHLPRNNQDVFAQEVNKIMAYKDQYIGDSEYLWLCWNFDQQSEYIKYVTNIVMRWIKCWTDTDWLQIQ